MCSLSFPTYRSVSLNFISCFEARPPGSITPVIQQHIPLYLILPALSWYNTGSEDTRFVSPPLNICGQYLVKMILLTSHPPNQHPQTSPTLDSSTRIPQVIYCYRTLNTSTRRLIHFVLPLQ